MIPQSTAVPILAASTMTLTVTKLDCTTDRASVADSIEDTFRSSPVKRTKSLQVLKAPNYFNFTTISPCARKSDDWICISLFALGSSDPYFPFLLTLVRSHSLLATFKSAFTIQLLIIIASFLLLIFRISQHPFYPLHLSPRTWLYSHNSRTGSREYLIASFALRKEFDVSELDVN